MEPVAVERANRVLVEDVPAGARLHPRHHHRAFFRGVKSCGLRQAALREQARVPLGGALTGSRPGLQVPQFHQQHRCLQRVQAAVEAHFLVVVAVG